MSDAFANNLFRAFMVLWVLLAPFNMRFSSQDGAGFIAAAEQVVDGDTDLVYAGGVHEFAITDERTQRLICESDLPAAPCDSYARYLSTPAALPLIAPFGLGSPFVSLLLWRLTIAACLVWGMVLLHERLAPTPRGPALMAGAAVLLLPAAHFLIGMGQTSGTMFLAVALGVSGASSGRGRAVGSVVASTASIVTKVVPALTLIPLWLLGARRAAAATAVAVAGLALAITAVGGLDIWATYVRLSADVGASTDGAAISARLTRWVPLPVVLAVVVGFVALLWSRRRWVSADFLYAGAWVATIAVTPFLWNHYLWVCFAALVIAYAERRASSTLAAAVAFCVGEAVMHIGGSPEARPLWRVAVVVLTAAALVQSALSATDSAEPELNPRRGAAPLGG